MSAPHRLSIRVYYEDTDFSGVVYHASYLKFCERGRSDFIRNSASITAASRNRSRATRPCSWCGGSKWII